MGQDCVGLTLSPNLPYPSHMKKRAYRIFIPSYMNMLSCMVMVIWMDRKNCSALSLLLLKLSGSAALAPLGKWLPVGMFVRITCAMANTAFTAASETWVWASMA